MRPRYIISLVIIVLGATTSYLMATSGNNNNLKPPDASIFSTGPADGSRQFAAITGIETPSGDTSASSERFAPLNITERVFDRYGQETLQLNKNAAGKNGPIALPTENVLDRIIAEELSASIDWKEFSLRDIRTSPSSDRQTVVAYLTALMRAYENAKIPRSQSFHELVARTATTGNVRELQKYSELISPLIDNLLELSAPRVWEDFHLLLVNYWQHRLVLAQAVLGLDADPLRAVIAVQELSESVDGEVDLLSLAKEKLAQMNSASQ